MGEESEDISAREIVTKIKTSNEATPFFVLVEENLKGTEKKLKRKKVIAEAVIPLKIRFQSGSAKLLSTDQTEKELNKLKLIVTSFPKDRIWVIESLTDRSGSSEFNLQLSQKRASTITQYLQKADPSLTNLVAIGKGESETSGADEIVGPSSS